MFKHNLLRQFLLHIIFNLGLIVVLICRVELMTEAQTLWHR